MSSPSASDDVQKVELDPDDLDDDSDDLGRDDDHADDHGGDDHPDDRSGPGGGKALVPARCPLSLLVVGVRG